MELRRNHNSKELQYNGITSSIQTRYLGEIVELVLFKSDANCSADKQLIRNGVGKGELANGSMK